ncbi:MAG: hypothetical protein RMJ65_00525, partial [candidate division WOR-3 bacterium]|nr:hypothetical protein [candidate division WOR-3 bacterium]
VFCFMHKSFWKDAYINNKPDTLHKLFVKYGVDYVFSGHDHFYCQLIWDGITYTQVGPSGSRYKQYKKEEYGAFQNFVLVTVKNNDVIIKVIKPDGSVLNSDIVTLPDIKELEKIEQSLQIVQNEDTVEVLINNITDFSFNSRGKWEFNPKNWTIVPQETVVLIPPHGNKSFKFHWQTANESVYPLPRFSIFYPYSKLGTKTYKVEKLFPVHRQAQCSKVSGVIKIDGQLNEKVWQKKSINIFGSSEGNVSNTDPWWVSFAYDKDNLYIGAILYDIKPDSISTKITERDDKVYNDDHINIILQPHVTQDTYYQFFINARGTVMDRKCYMIGKDSKKEFKWNSNIIVQTRIVKSKDFNGWILEAALPLKDITFKVPQTWGFNIARFQKRKEEVSVFSVPFEHNPKTFATLKFIY